MHTRDFLAAKMTTPARLTRTAFALLVFTALATANVNAQKRATATTVPATPWGVIAVPLRDAAVVAWLGPESATRDRAASAYTITAYDNIAPASVASSAQAEAPGAEIGGLIGNHCYRFLVRATNSAGSSPDSVPSDPVCLPPVPGADLAVKASSADSADQDSGVIFTMVVTNNGVADAPMVTLEDNLVTPLASFTTTQGVCQPTGGGLGLRCNLGTIYYGGEATVTIAVPDNGKEFTNTATAKAFDASGKELYDPVLDNNTATMTAHPAAKSSPQ